MHAVTISGSQSALADAAKILAEYDRSPVTLTLNFQLIAADSTKTRDPAVAGVDSLLRGVLKFSGVPPPHARAFATVSQGSEATQDLSVGGVPTIFGLSCDGHRRSRVSAPTPARTSRRRPSGAVGVSIERLGVHHPRPAAVQHRRDDSHREHRRPRQHHRGRGSPRRGGRARAHPHRPSHHRRDEAPRLGAATIPGESVWGNHDVTSGFRGRRRRSQPVSMDSHLSHR